MRSFAILLTLTAFVLVPSAQAQTERPSKQEVRELARSVQTPQVRSCSDAVQGSIYYRLRHASWMSLRGVEVKVRVSKVSGCDHARWRAQLWKERASQARTEYIAWHQEQMRRMLRDTPSWRQAVHTVQRVFPGTESWLLSCSDAEGWNASTDTRWVVYGGRPYWPGAEYSYNGSLPQVGGPMQFMWGTFKGMYRRGLEYAIAKGYKVEPHLLDPGNVRAWRSMLAQAIAAGWARYTGNDNEHWSASWGNGC